MTNNVVTRPGNVAAQILAGLEYTKIKTGNDRVATTIDVTGPQSTPVGSPVDGQVTVSPGAPIEKYITFTLDTSAFEADDEVVGYIGDSSLVHANSCNTCNEGENVATTYIKSATCNQYATWLNRLCSTPYTFASVDFKVRLATGETGELVLPERIEWSRQNLNGEGKHGIIEVENMENLEAFERSSVRYTNLALTGEENFFDRDMRMRIPGLQGGRIYKLTFYTAFRKDN